MAPASLLLPKPDPDATPDPGGALPAPAPAPAAAAVPLTRELCAALGRVAAKSNSDTNAPMISLTPELIALLRGELEPSPDDDSDLTLRLRLTQQRLDAISATPPPPPPQPPQSRLPPPPAGAPSPVTPPAPPSAHAIANLSRALSSTARLPSAMPPPPFPLSHPPPLPQFPQSRLPPPPPRVPSPVTPPAPPNAHAIANISRALSSTARLPSAMPPPPLPLSRPPPRLQRPQPRLPPPPAGAPSPVTPPAPPSAHAIANISRALSSTARLPSAMPPPPRPLSHPPPSLLPPPPPRAPSPPPSSAHANPERALSTAAAAADARTRRKRPRGTQGGEMVRVTVSSALANRLHCRALVRRARLTFEALWGRYHRNAEQNPVPGRRNRADLRALGAMIEGGLCVNRDKRIEGPVPGVFVGDAFNYQAQLLVIGLHNQTQASIGYVPASKLDEGRPVATSIVSSGRYLDDQNNGDVLIYTGSGGHHSDQEFQGGNLALKYSCKYGIDVRVIRCHDCDASPSGKLYVYDGLYKVVSATCGPGKSGPVVCKFTLVRVPGQEALGSNMWSSARDIINQLDAKIRPPAYITLDMSKGKEAVPVPVHNTVDHDVYPLNFEYLARPEFPAPAAMRGHRCCIDPKIACSERSGCACVKRSGGGGPAYNADGMLLRGRPVVYECGASCGCPASCPNRVTQRGMRHRLEVFRSNEMKWGVRTLDMIQPGAFLCEFTGDVLPADHPRIANTSASTEERAHFIDPRKFPMRWAEWGYAPAAVLPDDGEEPPRFAQCRAPGYVFDVSKRKNIAAYISHSRFVPNAFVQLVVRGDEDESYPHLMVFAMETIPPMRELSIDYGVDQ